MSISVALYAVAIVTMAGSWFAGKRGLIQNPAELALATVANLAVFVGELVDGAVVGAVINGSCAAVCAYLWWKGRRKGGWRRAARELGAKSKARVEALVEQMTRSPIPSPASGAR
jgi:hypothetical protein